MNTSASLWWRLGLALLPLIVLVAFYPALSNDYVWDDHMYFSAFPVDVYFSSWWENGLEPFSISANYFRPVAMLSFLADFAAGPSEAASHFINLALHALNVVLVAWLASRLLRLRGGDTPAWIPLAAGLWYALHPALIESVSFVMCRFDLLVTTFALAMLHVSLAPGRWVLPALSLLFLGALFSKENAAGLLVAWPFWIAAVALLRGEAKIPPIAGAIAKGLGALLAGLLLDLALRYWARGFVWLFGEGGMPLAAHAQLIAMSLAEQIRLMFLPFGETDPFHTAAGFGALNYGFAALVLGGIALLAWHPRTRPAAALLLAALASLGPTSNLIPIAFSGGVYTADRYLTMPLIFVAPVVAFALLALAQRSELSRKSAIVLLAGWLLVSLLLIRTTIPLMKDDAHFWAWVMQRHPGETVAANNLADALINQQKFAEAMPVLGAALKLDDRDASLWHNVARADQGLGELAPALEAIDRALALDATNEHFWHTKATLLAGIGDLAGAEALIRDKVLTANPHLVSAHLNLLRLMVATDRAAEARVYIDAHPDVFTGAWREQALAILR